MIASQVLTILTKILPILHLTDFEEILKICRRQQFFIPDFTADGGYLQSLQNGG